MKLNKTSPHTEEFQIFQSNIINSQSFILICSKSKLNVTNMFYAMLCYSLATHNLGTCYEIVSYNGMILKCHGMKFKCCMYAMPWCML